jgi:hypothetical protein
MAEYTVVKVSHVPDQSVNLGEDPDQFEIRFIRNDLGCEHCGVSFARYTGLTRPGRSRTGRGLSPASFAGGLTGSERGGAPNDAATRSLGGAP